MGKKEYWESNTELMDLLIHDKRKGLIRPKVTVVIDKSTRAIISLFHNPEESPIELLQKHYKGGEL